MCDTGTEGGGGGGGGGGGPPGSWADGPVVPTNERMVGRGLYLPHKYPSDQIWIYNQGDITDAEKRILTEGQSCL